MESILSSNPDQKPSDVPQALRLRLSRYQSGRYNFGITRTKKSVSL